ncbi:CGNR zinc finger domain-containing protein [Streptomyces apricus]|uniref:Zinc finger CGNR domain-containing protein n=1 Tax=Streptomyces apricus TaxID=1828112 RepID=A0A5A9ZWC8_9ACTN|nr:CGNR zinc finger domain-containing protein [Streptomyces apricus]KAA0921351.1 hypothetical protein FGF04_36880 [Streptomyces apricus]
MEEHGQEDPDVDATRVAGDGHGRFRVTMAPGDLLLVQELLNTAPLQKPGQDIPDLLDAPDTAARWLRAYGIAGDSPGVSDLRALRDALRRALIARDHDPVEGEGEGAGASASAVEAAARIRLDTDGTVRITPDSVGIAALGHRVLLAVHDSQLTGAWRRLKLCRNPQCLVAFWDGSRNTSGVWHDVRTCGNAANLRKSRARRAARAAGPAN